VVLVLGGIVTLITAALALGLEFHDSVQAMRPTGNPGVAVREEVAERFGLGFEQMMLLLEGESMAEVLDLASTAAELAAELVEDGVLTGYDTVTSLIPPVAVQRENLEWLAAGRAEQFDTRRIREVFASQVTAEGMRLDPFVPGLDLFEQALGRERLLGLEDFQDTPQTERLLERYLTTDGTDWKAVVYLFPPPKIWRRQPPPQTVAMAERLGPQAKLTGANVVSRFLRERVLEDAVLAAVIGFVVVGILLWLDFRSLPATVMSLAPLLMGVVWMLGGMAALGESMNFMNIFVTTMIIGIGVDYGIHMLHRYRELRGAGEGELESGLVETGKAIVLAALSTTVGFGSLSFSHYPGLQSMGKVAILGALSTALVAITVLPAFLVTARRWRKN
jgi:predicted exporter